MLIIITKESYVDFVLDTNKSHILQIIVNKLCITVNK